MIVRRIYEILRSIYTADNIIQKENVGSDNQSIYVDIYIDNEEFYPFIVFEIDYSIPSDQIEHKNTILTFNNEMIKEFISHISEKKIKKMIVFTTDSSNMLYNVDLLSDKYNCRQIKFGGIQCSDPVFLHTLKDKSLYKIERDFEYTPFVICPENPEDEMNDSFQNRVKNALGKLVGWTNGFIWKLNRHEVQVICNNISKKAALYGGKIESEAKQLSKESTKVELNENQLKDLKVRLTKLVREMEFEASKMKGSKIIPKPPSHTITDTQTYEYTASTSLSHNILIRDLFEEF